MGVKKQTEIARFTLYFNKDGKVEFSISESNTKKLAQVIPDYTYLNELVEAIDYVQGRFEELGRDLINRYGEDEKDNS